MIIESLLKIHSQLKIMYWQTISNYYHNAFNKAYEEIVSSLFGVDDRSYRHIANFKSINIQHIGIGNVKSYGFLEKVLYFINVFSFIPYNRTVLYSTKYEMLALIDKTKYFLNLK